MAERLNVNPTRMELTKLKKQLKTAQRGHKLLKDKNDELMKRFLDMIRENKRLREEVEQAVQAAHQNFAVAKSVMSASQIGEALMLPKVQVAVSVSQKNIMSVVTPVFEFHTQNCTQNCVQSGVKEDGQDASPADFIPYGYGFTSGELDDAVLSLHSVMGQLLRLAEIEKTAQLLAGEIEKTRRRVNALEHVLIPQYTATIKYITMKLDEAERGSITRLMKVKDMMIAQQILQKAHEREK